MNQKIQYCFKTIQEQHFVSNFVSVLTLQTFLQHQFKKWLGKPLQGPYSQHSIFFVTYASAQ